MSALIELAERCEAAAGPDREMDVDIHEALGNIVDRGCPAHWHDPEETPLYTASIDAALMLVPEGYFMGSLAQADPAQGATLCYAAVVQNEFCDIDRGYGQPPDQDRDVFESHATTPALALTAAALRATASMEVE